jgi:hypothetical protein
MPAKRPPIFEVLKSLVRPVVTSLFEQLHPDSPSDPVVKDLCELSDVIEFSVQVRRQHPDVTSILLKKERLDDRLVITHVLLDGENKLIRKGKGLLGRTLAVKAVDDELRDLFGDTESLVIELPPQHDSPQYNS